MLSGKGLSTNQLLRGGLRCDMVDYLSDIWRWKIYFHFEVKFKNN